MKFWVFLEKYKVYTPVLISIPTAVPQHWDGPILKTNYHLKVVYNRSHTPKFCLKIRFIVWDISSWNIEDFKAKWRKLVNLRGYRSFISWDSSLTIKQT